MRLLSHIKTMILATAAIIAAGCVNDHGTEKIVGDVAFAVVSDAFAFMHGDKVAVMGAERPFTAKVDGDDVSLIGDVTLADEY